ncbi:MAG: methyltransferase domain-containing protein [Planctomycetes bacterium]|nr:methyltransferase domain-containing protein [Planctomycetota bacterium]MCB9916997.1 methyltransferase domain-containing protein [Planctomycetota bacterium]
MSQRSYFIKAGYRAREAANTIEVDPGDYWTLERIESSMRFQHDVYRLALDCAQRMGSGLRIADVGCGYPSKARLLQPFARTLTCFDQPTLESIVRRDFPGFDFVSIDLEAPRALDARFDLVICADVIEHLVDPDPCLSFLRDSLTEHGILILSTPERDIVRGHECMTSDKVDHVREWNSEEFARYVQSHGLLIVDHLLVPPEALSLEEQHRMHQSGERKTRRSEGCQVVVATAVVA